MTTNSVLGKSWRCKECKKGYCRFGQVLGRKRGFLVAIEFMVLCRDKFGLGKVFYVATEYFYVMTKFGQGQEFLCSDRVFLCRDRVWPWMGFLCHDRVFLRGDRVCPRQGILGGDKVFL